MSKFSSLQPSAEECPERHHLFAALIEADDGQQAQLLQDHYQSCRFCQQAPFEQLEQSLFAMLNTWQKLDAVPEREPSADFMLRLKQRVIASDQAEQLNATRRNFWQRINRYFEWAKLPALAAVLYLIFSVQVQTQLNQPKHQSLMVKVQIQKALESSLAQSFSTLGEMYRNYLKQRRQG